MLKHNNIEDNDIRKYNEKYNRKWIKKNNLMYFHNIKVEKFENKSTSKKDSSPMMVVWLKNIDRLMDLIPKSYDITNYHLLDVGCGSGISTIYFNQTYIFKSYSGFDFESKFIEYCKINNKKSSLSNIDFYVKDVMNIILDDRPTFLFLFNPFGLTTMKTFLENNIDNLKKNKSIIGYVNDIHVNYFNSLNTHIIRNDNYNISIILF